MTSIAPAESVSHRTDEAAPPGRRRVILASADAELRQHLRSSLENLRWSVTEVCGGAEALAQIEAQQPEALVLDHWLPDLEIRELELQIRQLYPLVDLVHVEGDALEGGRKSPRRPELLQALREIAAASHSEGRSGMARPAHHATAARPALNQTDTASIRLPELIGESEPMLELGRLIRLVAPRSTSVLIEGETGTGKEVVAHALYRLSARAAKPFAILNCAAIPESLLEAELFGHARGAFTGAVGARVGRIEAANGGTLFLDEIGEMPLALQAKMLRFLECGELQRIGENEITRVDVRIIAATHQHLEQRAEEGTFRLDLYHRLAVFPLDVPPLRERVQDIQLLAEHLLSRLTRDSAPKRLEAEALRLLEQHVWPGNVRELAHVLERALILSCDEPIIAATQIRYRRRERN